MRAPFQVLVFPFRREGDAIRYYLFKRTHGQYWQGISGGGEDNEIPIEAAIRESMEEAAIGNQNNFVQLDAVCSIPVTDIQGFIWGSNILVVPEYSFGVELQKDMAVTISGEHTECIAVTYEEALEMLKWDSNRTALWELNYRLKHGL